MLCFYLVDDVDWIVRYSKFLLSLVRVVFGFCLIVWECKEDVAVVVVVVVVVVMMMMMMIMNKKTNIDPISILRNIRELQQQAYNTALKLL